MPAVLGFFETVGASNLPFISDASQFPGSEEGINQLENNIGCANCLTAALGACIQMPSSEDRDKCESLKSSLFTTLGAEKGCAMKGKTHGLNFSKVFPQCRRMCSPDTSMGYAEGYDRPYQEKEQHRNLHDNYDSGASDGVAF